MISGESASLPLRSRGGTFTLRRWRDEDLDRIVASANDARVSKWLRWRFPFPYTRKDGEKWLGFMKKVYAEQDESENSAGDIFLCIDVHSDDGKGPIGGISVEHLYMLDSDPHSACSRETGYWLGAKAWGRGIASEALKMITRYAFDTFPSIARIEASACSRNFASCRVLQKAGFTFEGLRKRDMVPSDVVRSDEKGNVHDSLRSSTCYALMRDDVMSSNDDDDDASVVAQYKRQVSWREFGGHTLARDSIPYIKISSMAMFGAQEVVQLPKRSSDFYTTFR